MHDSTGVLERPPTVPRIVGRITGDRPGPSLIVMAALHGNEPAGLLASQRLLARLRSERTPLRGELTVLAGNLTAIRERTRFLQKDLNRQWTPDRIAALRTTIDAEQAGAEDREQLELLQALAEVIDAARGPVYFIDLHTSSAAGGPFLTVGDTLRNRNFALSFPLPLILGLEEEVDGSLL